MVLVIIPTHAFQPSPDRTAHAAWRNALGFRDSADGFAEHEAGVDPARLHGRQVFQGFSKLLLFDLSHEDLFWGRYALHGAAFDPVANVQRKIRMMVPPSAVVVVLAFAGHVVDLEDGSEISMKISSGRWGYRARRLIMGMFILLCECSM